VLGFSGITYNLLFLRIFLPYSNTLGAVSVDMRRSGIPYLTVILICAFFIAWFLLPSHQPPLQRLRDPPEGKTPITFGELPDDLLHGDGIMPKLGNETIK